MLQCLQQDYYPHQPHFVEWMLKMTNNVTRFPALVLYSDETTFRLDGILNLRNQHVWSDSNPHCTTLLNTSRQIREHLGRYPRRLRRRPLRNARPFDRRNMPYLLWTSASKFVAGCSVPNPERHVAYAWWIPSTFFQHGIECHIYRLMHRTWWTCVLAFSFTWPQ